MAELIDAPDVGTITDAMLFPVASADGSTLLKATGAEVKAYAGGGGGGGGGVDAWTALTFSATSPTFGAMFHISDQTFTIADGDRIEAEAGFDGVGSGTGGAGVNGIGFLQGDAAGFVSYLDQNNNRALGVLSGGAISSVPFYFGSGFQQGGGNWALAHNLFLQTSKLAAGTVQAGIGSAGAGASGGYMIAGELAGAAGKIVALLPTASGTPSVLWARARLRKAGS